MTWGNIVDTQNPRDSDENGTHVSGAIALLLSATNIRDGLSGADRAFTISDLITGSVDDIGENGQDNRFGFGRLDALRAMIDKQPESICSLIVDAELSKRTFEFGDRESKKLVQATPDTTQQRLQVMSRLATKLRKLAGAKNVNVIESSGAIVIKIPAKQIKEVSKTADVKVIRPNRRLPPIRLQRGPE